MAAPPDHDAAREDRRGYSEGCQCLKCEHFRTCGTCQSQGGKACTKCQREMWTKFAACRKCKKCTDYYEHFYPYIECLALQARTLWTMAATAVGCTAAAQPTAAGRSHRF